MELFEPQLARLETRPPNGPEWIHEIKFDGYRTLAYCEGRSVSLRTRSGLDWTEKYQGVAKAVSGLRLKDTVLDGEIVWVDGDGRSDFQQLQNSLKMGDSTHLVYFVFDVLEYRGRDCRDLRLLERKEILQKIFSARSKMSPSVRLAESWTDDSNRLLAASCQLGLEGLISKRVDSTYEAGRPGTWIKSKCTNVQEFVIGGYTLSASRVGFRSLLLGVYNEQGEFEYVGRVGSGFTQRSLMELSARMKPLAIEESPFDVRSPRSASIVWLEPKLVAQVKFTEWTSDLSLRHPVFEGLRDDKKARAVRAESGPLKSKLGRRSASAEDPRAKRRSSKHPRARSRANHHT